MRTLFMLLSMFLMGCLSAQEVPPKFEFRAAWVATVNNIDWPSKPGLSAAEQQQEAIDMLDLLKKHGMNAVIFQVRPASDAIYASKLEPWSRYLTGTPGKHPGYDPLQFWIDECHKRNMELHAWFNPFRVAQRVDEPLASNHIAFQHPEWIIAYGGKLYFNPALPETRQYIAEVVKDVVIRYDVDAIHFDDYFYPYPVAGEPFPDLITFNQTPRGFGPDQLNDWRRDNVDQTIQLLSKTIKETKPWVKFGISPFGVWRNQADDPRGSMTMAGNTNFDHLYADILKWQEKEWIDYATPQLYWQIGHPAVDFELLCNWWNENRNGRALYIGHALYKSESNSAIEAWRQADQLPRQIELTRQIKGIEGSAFYSAKHFNRDLMGFQDSLQQRLYKYPAIVPPMSWIDNKTPVQPQKFKKSGRKLKWKTREPSSETDKTDRFILYRNKVGEKFDPNDPRFILLITRSSSIRLEKGQGKKEKFEFRVSALDRLNNESKLTKPVTLKW
ncbi:glycoside hydrolase family 10 protein [Gaoshiqia sediminis]|uniref:Family 10 glycosylhydrolase n=1 Tax=Gaoshiqia sediminis TaxID=2986998 RepID=A0AA41YAA8_9BACT|nr:family 10 glycosylhydrolase [Gaoshiqia sediminis]MCW0484237.1 family 10 glycosylhydrolase [Gaoshiqia sediminis]